MTAQGTFELRSGKFTRKVRAIAASGGLALAINFGCTDRLPVEAAFDVLDTPMTVTGADPAEGEQGETLEVRVFGTGFENDVLPAWERNGVVDPRIGVGQVIVVNSTELRATIIIAGDAELGDRDISVSGRKKGIGSESPRAVGEALFVVNEYTPQPLEHISEGLWTGFMTMASAINTHGVIVGRSSGFFSFGAANFAVYWSVGAGAVPFAGDQGFASGINNNGWIVGARGIRLIGTFARYNVDPFLFRDGVVTDLPPLEWPYESVAIAINDAGTIVGHGARDPGADPTWPIVWQPSKDGGYGQPNLLPLRLEEEWQIGEYWEGSSAYAINARGDIAGTLQLAPRTCCFLPSEVAVLWRARPDGSYELPLVLGVLGEGVESAAVGLNDAGWVVGTLGGWNEPMRPVLWHPDNYNNPILLPVELGAGGSANGVNNKGQIVGYQRRGALSDRGIVWTVDSNGTTLKSTLLQPTSLHTASTAWGINDAGWIVGTSVNYTPGRMEATLWRPDM